MMNWWNQKIIDKTVCGFDDCDNPIVNNPFDGNPVINKDICVYCYRERVHKKAMELYRKQTRKRLEEELHANV